MITRRHFLAGASAICTCPIHSGVSQTNARPIDCHFHIMPPEFRKMLGDDRADRRMDDWTVDKSLEAMAQVNAQIAITSITTPGVWFNDVAESRLMCRVCNDYAKQLEAFLPGTFRSYATIPLPDAEGSLSEITYALDVLNFEGVAVFTSYKIDGEVRWLGDPLFEPVMEELNRRGAVVRTHPDAPCCAGFLVPLGIVDAIIEYGADTTRALAKVIFSGWLQKYPHIKWIWGHGGGDLPYLIDRFNRLPNTIQKLNRFAPDGFLVELAKMYFDTAQIAHPTPLRSLADVVPVERILFGSDFPYRRLDDHATALGLVFNSEEHAKINQGNILPLMRK